MTNREIVLRLARAVAPDAMVSVPAGWLLEALGDGSPIQTDDPIGDLDAHDLAKHYKRSPKTIRAWLAAGVFEQAYRGPKGWMVPRGALRHVQPKQRKRAEGSGEPSASTSGNCVGIRGQR